MVKVKNKKSSSADNLRNKRKTITKPNPFEFHVNKQKFSVLGQKSKNDRGLPGISRAKALKKRKNTLLPEFNLQHKANQFLDRRIGERNRGMTAEDRIMARFTAERVKIHNKKSIFNLGDDEILTHRGQTLTEIEKFDDPRSEDEFSDDGGQNHGRLDAGFVADAHFGGGMLSNTGKDGARSRKDLIEQLIDESKKRKAEKQKLREDTIELTAKLDSEWKDLLPLVNNSKKSRMEQTPVNNDSYDKVMRELKFEARGNPTDKLKTEDEIAKEEKARLEQLENDRLARMKGFINDKEAQPKHRSADDLDDDFENFSDLEDNEEENKSDCGEEKGDDDVDPESGSDSEAETDDDLSDLKDDESSSEDDEMVATEETKIDKNNTTEKLKNKEDSSEESLDNEEIVDGKMNEAQNNGDEIVKSLGDDEITLTEKNNDDKINESENNEDSSAESSGDEEIAPTEELEDDDDNATTVEESSVKANKRTPTKVTKAVNGKNTERVEEENDASEECESEYKESICDTDQKKDRNNTNTVENPKNVDVIPPSVEHQEDHAMKALKIKEDLLARKKVMEQAREELPYTFDIPTNYEEFQKLFSQHSFVHQSVIVERMIKCNHQSLSENNRSKLSELFTFLLQHLNDVSLEGDSLNCFQTLDHLAPWLFDLAQTNSADAHNAIMEVLKEKHGDYKKRTKRYPGLDTLIFLKLISLLFPTSDFRHQVVTPALVFMSQILTRSHVKTRSDLSRGLFLVTLILEYTTLSKKFMPAAINFLRGLLHYAVPKSTVRIISVIPPFKSSGSSLVLSNKYVAPESFTACMKGVYLISESEQIDDDFRVRTMCTTLQLCSEYFTNLQDIPCRNEIFDPIYGLLYYLPTDNYPDVIIRELTKLQNQLSEGISKQTFSYLVLEKKKPKVLRQYEPDIKQIFENRKHKNISKERADHEKLIHKLKKEKKGALREIRRDNAFLTNLKIKKQMQSDLERKLKVKEILTGASIQQGELNAIDRKKKK